MKYHAQLKQQKRFPFWGLFSIYINFQFFCGRIAQYGFFLLVHNRSFIKENTGKLFSVSVDTGCHLGAEKMNRNQAEKEKKNIKTTELVALIETRRTLSQSQPHRIGCSNWHFVPLPTGAAGGSSAGSPPVVQCRISPGLVPLLRSAPGSPAPHGCSLPFPPADFPSCLLTGTSPFLSFLLPVLCFLRSKVLSDQPCNTRLP